MKNSDLKKLPRTKHQFILKAKRAFTVLFTIRAQTFFNLNVLMRIRAMKPNTILFHAAFLNLM